MAKGTINIYDYIGKGGIESKDILHIMDGFKENEVNEIEVRINSPGGSIFEGFSIFNQLRDFKNVTTVIDGIASSIASIIALAGNSIKAYKNSYIFIHNPWSLAIGDTNDMQKVSDDLEKFRDTIIELYKSKTGKSEDDLKEFCNNSTFLTSQEALELGFIDEIIDNYPNTKSFVALYSDINGAVSLNDPVNQPIDQFYPTGRAVDLQEIQSLIEEVRNFLDTLNNNEKGSNNFSENLDTQISNLDSDSFNLDSDTVDLSVTVKFLDSKIESGELLPALKENFMNILENFYRTDEESFNSAVQNFFKLIPSGSNLLEKDIAVKPENESLSSFDEYELEAVDKDSLALHKKAKILMNENNISYKEAIVNLSKIAIN